MEDEIRAQMARLTLDHVDAIMVPSATDLLSPMGPVVWDRLKSLRDQGLCAKIGVSVYSSDDPIGLARRFKPDLIQAPASLLDQRMLIDGTLSELAGMGIETAIGNVPKLYDTRRLEIIGEKVIPAVANLEPQIPSPLAGKS